MLTIQIVKNRNQNPTCILDDVEKSSNFTCSNCEQVLWDTSKYIHQMHDVQFHASLTETPPNDSSDNDESESSDSDEEYLPNEASPQLEHDMLAEFWEKIDDLDSVSKCHEAYEFGMQLIGNFISDFSADRNALIELLQRGNVSSAHYEQDYRQLQVCLSLHMIQFLKFDTCFWILLDDIAFDLSLQDTSAVDFRARELLSEIRMYEQQIDARIAEANFGREHAKRTG
ncbi:hypothetical protein JCM33374_g2092 [Metschnikowia sp. JCM 33374]|nr:hypothetical protein JCM33374_g2092 [Metschnikowia sp. JCM 33374]